MVPSRIRVRSGSATRELDFRDSRFTAPVVGVEVDLSVGNLDVRLPPGATVDLERAVRGSDHPGPDGAVGRPRDAA